MISENVFRRTIDPFAMFDYIGELRIGHEGKKSAKSLTKSALNIPERPIAPAR
jgi:hypothetical protein|tara:strand:- start:350 stop:508 length:159 start_codon:yes stop_codon:yes gene_type:complete